MIAPATLPIDVEPADDLGISDETAELVARLLLDWAERAGEGEEAAAS